MMPISKVMVKKCYFRFVRKISAIFLLSVYLFSVVQLSELLKINALVEHFYETRQNEPNISFLSFLAMHYVIDDGNALDNDRDCQLPFKSGHNINAGSFSTFILNRSERIAVPLAMAGSKDFYHYNSPFLSSNFYNLVWNPPRFC